MTRRHSRRATRRKNLARNLARLRALQETSPAAVTVDPWQALADRILHGAADLAGSTRGLIALRVPQGGARFRVLARRGFAKSDPVLLRALSETLRRGHDAGPLMVHAGVDGGRAGAVVTVPLLAHGGFLGALVLDDPTRDHPLSAAEMTRLREFADSSAVVLSHSLLESSRTNRASA